MHRFFTLFSFRAVPVAVHWSFLFIGGWIVLDPVLASQPASLSLQALLPKLILLLAILASVLGPALIRAWVALRADRKVNKIRLLPIGAAIAMDRAAPLSRPLVLFHLVGPVVNGLIALVVLLLLPGNLSGLLTSWQEPASGQNWLYSLLWVNLGLAAVPLLPTFSAGSDNLWVEVLSGRMDKYKAMRVVAVTGNMIAVGVMLLGAVYSLVLASFGGLLFIASHTQWDMVRRLRLLRDVRVRSVTKPDFELVQPNDRIREIIARVNVIGKAFLVMEHEQIVGVVSFMELVELYQAGADRLPVGYVMERHFSCLDATRKLEEVYQEAQWEAAPLYLVYEDGTLLGVTRLEEIKELLSKLREGHSQLIP